LEGWGVLRGYSYLNESTGFLNADLPILNTIVRVVATNIIEADRISIPGLISTKYCQMLPISIFDIISTRASYD
jgi:hypothetical protein